MTAVPTLAHVAFIGLGTMGAPMAANLVRRGVRLTGIARRASALAELQQLGARTALDPAAAEAADVVFLCLPDGEAVQDLVLRGEEPGPGFRTGQTIVDMGTIGYRQAIGIAERLARAGITYLDAPVTGMAKRAREGTLTAMCGGDRSTFAQIRPLLDCVASDVLYLGESGSGQLAKLMNQLLFDINVAALAEILPMAVRLGLDPASVGRIVNGGTGRSYASEFFIPLLLQRKFDQGYPLKSAYKDLLSGVDVAMATRIPTPVLSAAVATYQYALLAGHGNEGKGAMIRFFESLLGAEFRDNEARPPS